jgi:hypothetical protein
LFHSDQRKIVFLASFLCNSAFDWYQALSDELRSGTFAAFKEAFFRTYSDGDLHNKAVEKLYVLAQHTGSVSEYLTQFDTWAGRTEYNDVTLDDAFYHGLSEHITQPSEPPPSDQLSESLRVFINELKPCTFFKKSREQEVFVCWIHPDRVSFSARLHQTTINSVLTMKEHVPSSIPLSPEGIPLKYLDLAAAFKTSVLDPTTGLPPHREYDLSIELDEHKPLPTPGKTYPLSPAETQSLTLF